MRLFISAAFLAVSTLIGAELASRIKAARDILAEMYSFCLHMSGCVRYDRSLPEAIVQSFLGEKDGLIGVCRKSISEGKSFLLAWEDALSDSRARVLSSDEIEVIRRLGLNFGRSDIESELARLTHISEQLDAMYQRRCEQCRRQCRLYVTVGFLIGVIILILMY